MSMLGNITSTGAGVSAMTWPIMFSAASEPPICADFRKVMRRAGWLSVMTSMISRR